MIIHLIFLAIITVLWCIGDHKNAWARDLVIPFLVGGILFSLILTLFVIPAIYTYLSKEHKEHA
jgi:Cu/Ag efflux pump CusA